MGSMTVNVFYYQINLIGIHQIIDLKFLQWRRSTGQDQNFHRYIDFVEIIIPSAPPTSQCRYDLGIHEFDRAM